MVFTEMAAAEREWATPACLAIGRALLAAEATGRECLSAGELASATHKDPSNTKTLADEMVEAGLLRREVPTGTRQRPGRPADWVYAFEVEQREEVERLLATADAPGKLRQGQQVVFAEVTGEQFLDLMRVLADARLMAPAVWSGLCDGERQEYLVAFSGDDPTPPAMDLMGALATAKIRARRASISQVVSTHQLVQQAERAIRNA
jgi:hypothetical protein